MASFLTKRVLLAIPIMLIVSMIVFFLMGVMGNPVRLLLPPDADTAQVEELTHAMGLDRPVYVRYGIYMKDLMHGDFGTSYHYNTPALPLVVERLPLTLELTGLAMGVAILMAVPLGVISALKRNSWIDLAAAALSSLGRSMPSFWLGLMLMIVVAVHWGLVPVSGLGNWKNLVLPTLTLGSGLAAILTRLVRSGLLEVLGQDYIRTARSKGLAERVVVYKHGLRNALIPVVTVMGLQIAELIGGSAITETVFALPGMGRLTVTALNQLDFAIVQTGVLIAAFVVVMMNLLVDVIYTVLDPRIRYS